jgi:hypothetical protein
VYLWNAHTDSRVVFTQFVPTYDFEAEYIAVSYRPSAFYIYRLDDIENQTTGSQFSEPIDTADSVAEGIAEVEEEAWDYDPIELDYAVCTFNRGYVEQTVFICLTCLQNTGIRAGICRECANFCHERQGHEVYNIGIKKDFRCDCGLSVKYPNVPCSLQTTKIGTNENNKYNHNFEDQWCYCHRREELPMYQCIDCMDWFHGSCLGIEYNEEFSEEYVCEDCIRENYPYLEKYPTEGTESTELPSIGTGCRRGRFLPANWKTKLTKEDKDQFFPNQFVMEHRPTEDTAEEEDIEFSDDEVDEEDENEEDGDDFIV